MAKAVASTKPKQKIMIERHLSTFVIIVKFPVDVSPSLQDKVVKRISDGYREHLQTILFSSPMNLRMSTRQSAHSFSTVADYLKEAFLSYEASM